MIITNQVLSIISSLLKRLVSDECHGSLKIKTSLVKVILSFLMQEKQKRPWGQGWEETQLYTVNICTASLNILVLFSAT